MNHIVLETFDCELPMEDCKASFYESFGVEIMCGNKANKYEEMLKLEQENIKGCLIISKENPQRLFAIFALSLMIGAGYHTVHANNQCMLCSLH